LVVAFDSSGRRLVVFEKKPTNGDFKNKFNGRVLRF
jgi:hypothetical protein